MNSGKAYNQDQLNFGGQPMTNNEIKSFALNLLHADTEDEVIEILKKAGYWDDRGAWRLYGDKEGNFAQIGNQQSFPEASLVEKTINCVDTRLLLECLLRGIDPESDSAPESVRDAVAIFFEDRRSKDDEAGTLMNWGSAQRTKESRKITIAATGGRPIRGKRTKRMCLTICDQGEGQSALRMPNTILSLNAKNKQRIRFVQGKFNMGGSGALRFCGKQGIQLVISRRNPKLAKSEVAMDSTAENWAVTVVRREEPSNKSGDPIHSEFTYLAPIRSDDMPRRGELLNFSAETLPLMPVHDEAYKKEVESGTLIKLFEYETTVRQSNVLMKDGLLFALERLMPEIALPIRIHECRGYEGVKERSFETPIAGLVVRLEDGRGDNLEPGFPRTAKLYAAGTQMTAKIYAFKEEKASTYLKDEGVIFEINGQSHGYLPKLIFSRRRKVGLPRLRDSLLVIVDCSNLSTTQRENLFMSSRDRLTNKEIRIEIEQEIMEMLKNNSALKQLQQDRRNKDIESKLSEERPLEEVLGKILKSSPTLKTLFLAGQRLSKPFQTGNHGGSGNDDGEGDGSTKKQQNPKDFIGKRHPTFFEVKGIHSGDIYRRNTEKGRRCRIAFKTDVENNYLDRPVDKGTIEIDIVDEDDFTTPTGNFVLDDGDGSLSFSLPPEADVDDAFTLQVTVNDPTLMEPFVCLIRLRVLQKKDRQSGKSTKKKKHGSGGGKEGKGVGISIPRMILVRVDDEHWKRHHFTPDTSCHVQSDPVIGNDGKETEEHTFYINVDNNALMTEMKYSKQDTRLLEAKFKYANVLLGLAMLHDDEQKGNGEDRNAEEATVQDRIRQVSQALAPVILPMIDQLSGLDEAELEEIGVLDDDQ